MLSNKFKLNKKTISPKHGMLFNFENCHLLTTFFHLLRHPSCLLVCFHQNGDTKPKRLLSLRLSEDRQKKKNWNGHGLKTVMDYDDVDRESHRLGKGCEVRLSICILEYDPMYKCIMYSCVCVYVHEVREYVTENMRGPG